MKSFWDKLQKYAIRSEVSLKKLKISFMIFKLDIQNQDITSCFSQSHKIFVYEIFFSKILSF